MDATCEGRILSNTSSQRPLGSQGWGWEKFPLGGVFTKPGVMSPLSALPSRQVFSESVENENQIIGRYRADWNFRILLFARVLLSHLIIDDKSIKNSLEWKNQQIYKT